MNCEYCNRVFSTKYVLANHQKRAKYCLDIQRKQGIIVEPDFYTCEYCRSEMAQNVKSRHLQNCKTRLNQEKNQLRIENNEYAKELAGCYKQINELEKQVKFYKELSEKELETISDIARQPKSTTNNTQNNTNNYNLVPLDMDDKQGIARIVEESFTDQYVFDGQKGIARFARDFYLKDKDGNVKYICTDPSRHTFRYKNIDGNMERDIKARKLTSAIANDVIKKSCDFVKNMDSELFVVCLDSANCITNLSKDNTQFCNELAVLTSINK